MLELDALHRTGDRLDALKAGSPPIYVIDAEWQAGAKLMEYQVTGDGEKKDAHLFCPVRLTLRDPGGIRELGVRPVRPVQTTRRRSVGHPPLDLAGQAVRDLRWSPLRLPRLEPVEPPFQVGVEPSGDGPGTDPEVGRDLDRATAAGGYEDDLEPVPELPVGGPAELGVEGVAFPVGEVDADHRCILPRIRGLLPRFSNATASPNS
jgi:hypothetical protein